MNDKHFALVWQYYEQWFHGHPAQVLNAWKDYFYTADINTLLQAPLPFIDDVDIVRICHFRNLEQFQTAFLTYWKWVYNEFISEEGIEADTSRLDKRFSDFLNHYYTMFHHLSVEVDLAVQMFHYVFGDTFDPLRELNTSVFQEKSWRPRVVFDVDRMIGNLCKLNRQFLFGKSKNDSDSFNVQPLMYLHGYFESILPELSDSFFSKELVDSEGIRRFERRHLNPDEGRLLSIQVGVRSLIANLYGFTTEYDVKDGVRELICSNEEYYRTILNIFEVVRKTRKPLDELIDMVCKAKGKCVEPKKRSVFSKK